MTFKEFKESPIYEELIGFIDRVTKEADSTNGIDLHYAKEEVIARRLLKQAMSAFRDKIESAVDTESFKDAQGEEILSHLRRYAK